MRKLFDGLNQFKKNVYAPQQKFWETLAKGQSPKAIFVTCADSRVDPNLLTQTGPGDLFVIRNAGNIVPAYNEQLSGEACSIEYGVAALGITDIVICGHTQCGAMKGLLHPESLTELPLVSNWLRYAQKVKDKLPQDTKKLEPACVLNMAVQENVLLQVENTKTLPIVARKISAGELQIHAWVYEIESGLVYVYSDEHKQFLPVEETSGSMDLVKHDELAEKCTVAAGHHLGHMQS